MLVAIPPCAITANPASSTSPDASVSSAMRLPARSARRMASAYSAIRPHIRTGEGNKIGRACWPGSVASVEDHGMDFDNFATSMCLLTTVPCAFGSDIATGSIVEISENLKELREGRGHHID